MNLEDKLKLWISNDWNAMFVGGHGIGKTSIIEKAFNAHNLKWQYFSAPTMDPWVDLVGVPKEKVDPDTGMSYLELIRPRAFEEDTVEAIFIDEFNRAQDKTTNAIMELLQFKSINGHQFKNLRFIWGAINPPDEEGTYHVNPLDPAVEDRFIIQVELPSEPSLPYFIDKYGEHVGQRAVDWWHNTLGEDNKKLVSPRRLDYALDVFQNGGDLADVLKAGARPQTLRRRLEKISGTTTHSERWMQDPDVYIKEVSDRQSTINVVDAMADLMDISLDLAVGYVGNLPSPRLNQLSADNRTIVLLIKHLSMNKSNRRIITALQRIASPKVAVCSAAGQRLTEVRASDVGLYALVVAADNDGIGSADEWRRLQEELQTRITHNLLEFDDCTMLLYFAGKVAHVAPSGAVIEMLTDYVIANHYDRVVDFVSVNPQAVASWS